MVKIGRISILITYYNEKELLIRCLQSINKQTLQPFEVIIYDDASKIDVRNYISPDLYDFEIRIIRNEENRGPGYGRNLLMNIAKGQFIRFQDADDELFENALLEIETIIEKSKSEIILNEVTSYNENGELVSEKVIGLPEYPDDMFTFSLTHYLLIPSITYKRKFAISIGGFRERDILPQAEDADFNRRVFLETNSFNIIYKSLIKQNIRLGSHSNKNYSQVWSSNLESLLLLKEKINSNHSLKYFDAILKTGLQLYYQKKYHLAKVAFDEYNKSNYAHLIGFSPLKRVLVKVFGLMMTEKLLSIYRKLLPTAIRKQFKKLAIKAL